MTPTRRIHCPSLPRLPAGYRPVSSRASPGSTDPGLPVQRTVVSTTIRGGRPEHRHKKKASRASSGGLDSKKKRMVPGGGFEPPRENSHCDLNAARLPIPPLRLLVPLQRTVLASNILTIMPQRDYANRQRRKMRTALPPTHVSCRGASRRPSPIPGAMSSSSPTRSPAP